MNNKIGMNLIVHCPNCEGTMIIANPLSQTTLQKQHKIQQQCGDCKATVIMWIEVRVVSWEIKPRNPEAE